MSVAHNTQVLVVGAGPVGMTVALLLARLGVEPTIIDEESGPAARSYACALHPYSLQLFERLGLLDKIQMLSRRIDTVAFYDTTAQRAAVKLSGLPAKFPFALILPQNALEILLENALAREAGIRVHWNHRLTELERDFRGVVSTVDELGGSATGYSIPHWGMVVKRSREVRSEVLVGADGHNSIVRRRLAIDAEQVGDPERFAVFEFETDAELPDEVRVVFDGATTNVLWPLPGGRYRWSFQLPGRELREDFPDKERRAYWIENPDRNQRVEQRLRRFLKVRAPWFKADIERFDWINHVQFERSVARRLVKDQCCLIGDAAHQTGPAGVQSLNVGLREADELSAIIAEHLTQSTSADDMNRWDTRWRKEWARLLGSSGSPAASTKTDAWVKEHAGSILPCLPASGEDLLHCMKQLELDLS